MSMRPLVSTMRAAAALAAPASVVSSASAMASPPVPVISSASARQASSRRDEITTRAPSAASPRATACPSQPVPPATQAILPSRFKFMLVSVPLVVWYRLAGHLTGREAYLS